MFIANGYFFCRETAVGFEANATYPSAALVDNAWRYTTTPYYASTALGLIKQRNIPVFTVLTLYFVRLPTVADSYYSFYRSVYIVPPCLLFKILLLAHKVYLDVLLGPQNKQQSFSTQLQVVGFTTHTAGL
jgi:hypothetical protein